jgi:hypothetical protein
LWFSRYKPGRPSEIVRVFGAAKITKFLILQTLLNNFFQKFVSFSFIRNATNYLSMQKINVFFY